MRENNDSIRSANTEGYDDGRKGLLHWENPYSSSTEPMRHEAWLKGWGEGQADRS